MIVKTGANYQAEGGYIEAGRIGDKIEVRTENKTITIPSISGISDTRVLCTIKNATGQSGGSFYGLDNSEPMRMSGHALPSGQDEITIWIWFAVGTPISMPGNKTAILLEGSQDCELKPGAGATIPCLYATGPNPIANLGVAD